MTTTAQDLERQMKEAALLSQLWSTILSADTAPEPAQFFRWASCFGLERTRAAIERTAVKFRLVAGQMDADFQRKYCTSVANAATKAASL